MTSGPSEILGKAIALDRVPAVVTVAGDLDLSTAPTLRDLLEALVEDGCTDIVLDLSALGFFDASGIRVLEHVMSLLLPRQGRLTLRSVPAQARRVLDITGFSALIGIEPTESPLPARQTPRLVVSLVDSADAPEEDWTDRMHSSLLSRQQIARAQGVLMEREHASADVADAILARASRSSRRTFLDQAIEVTGSAESRRPRIGGGTDPARLRGGRRCVRLRHQRRHPRFRRVRRRGPRARVEPARPLGGDQLSPQPTLRTRPRSDV